MVKFITIRGTRALSATPYYIGIPQHERIMSRREAYALAATALANNTTGAEHACEVVYSDLANVKAKLAVAAPAGEYTLKVYTRSGLGDAFGVKVASRKVTVG